MLVIMTESATLPPATSQVPDASGRFGDFGGRYVPETLTRALDELTEEYQKALNDPSFQRDLSNSFLAKEEKQHPEEALLVCSVTRQ